jgi:hypothetical protein
MTETPPSISVRVPLVRKMNTVTVINCSPSLWEVFLGRRPRPRKCPKDSDFDTWMEWFQTTNAADALAKVLLERSGNERVETSVIEDRWAGPTEYTSHPKFLQLRDAGADGGCLEIVYDKTNRRLHIGLNSDGTRLFCVY